MKRRVTEWRKTCLIRTSKTCCAQIRDEMGEHVARMGENDLWTVFVLEIFGDELKQGVKVFGGWGCVDKVYRLWIGTGRGVLASVRWTDWFPEMPGFPWLAQELSASPERTLSMKIDTLMWVWRIGGDMKCIGCALLLLQTLKETRETPSRITGVSAEIRTRPFPNKCRRRLCAMLTLISCFNMTSECRTP